MRIEVADTGAGIPASHLPHLFDQFYQVEGSSTRSQEGSGIGLALVKELVELHGGRVTVESTVDFGTRFIVTLPEIESGSPGVGSLGVWESEGPGVWESGSPNSSVANLSQT